MPERSGRFAIVPARAWDDTRMTPGLIRSLGAICCYADRDGWCWPRLTMLAKRIGIARPNLSRDITRLVELEYLEVQPQFRSDGSQTANKYRVLHDRVLPRSFDRWRPEVVDDDDVVISPEDFDETPEADDTGGVSPAAHPPRAQRATPPRAQDDTPSPATMTPRTDQKNGSGKGPTNTPAIHPDDALSDLAHEVVGEWWETKGAKPLQGRKTIEKLVRKALEAGNHASVVRLALDDCNTFTIAGLQLAISRVAPASVAAANELAGGWCSTCTNLGMIDDPDDPSVVHPCPACHPAA